MGAFVGVVESDGMMLEETILHTTSSSFSSAKQIGNPVVYKLVRVEGDGRLVPATDEEIMEVKDLLENNKNDMHIVTDTGQTLGFVSDEGLSSGLPRLENSEGLSQSDSREADAEKLNSRLQEERLCVTLGSPMHSAHVNAKSLCSSENNEFSGREDNVQSETALQDLTLFSTKGMDRCVHQPMKMGQCSKPIGTSKEAASSPAVQKPDFSKLKGEICLDNLSIKELQETFRATFGRETTVKDKLWLKRRIAVGLTNSFVIPTSGFTIKDNRLVGGQEENNNNFSYASDQIKGDHCAYGISSSPRDNFVDHDCGGEDFAGGQRAGKRLRKPTRRYIEEHSETDEKQQSGKSMNPSKVQRLSPKFHLRPIRAVSSRRRVVVTRTVSLAGSIIQVPFVSQVRRSRPRVNIMALVDCHRGYLEAKATSAENRQSLTPTQSNSDKFATGNISRNSKQYSGIIPIEVDQDMKMKHVDSSGDSYGKIQASKPIPKGFFRRKHQRAWTLSEVIKLVEGVSRFGAGKWSEIRRLSFSSYSYRTSVDLKDKWRNLLKASFAQTPSDRRGSFRKHGSTPVPTQILLRVRELAEKQSQLTQVNKASRDNSGMANAGFL